MRKAFQRLLWAVAISVLTACASPKVQSQFSMPEALDPNSLVLEAEDGYVLPYRYYPSKQAKYQGSLDQDAPSSEPQASSESNGLVIALHGFNDYKNAFVDLCVHFQNSGFDCLAYDQRSFGETAERGVWPSEGKLQQDVLMFVNEFSKRLPNAPIYLLGESMGGAVLISAWGRYSQELAQKVSGTILVAPAVWARETQPWYQRWALWLAVRVAPSWSPTGQGLKIRASDNDEALIGLGRDPLVIKKTRIDAVYGLTNLMDDALESVTGLPSNTLYLYGLNDQVIPHPATCRALDLLVESDSELGLKIYQEGYHMLTRDLSRESVFEDMVAWIKKPEISSSIQIKETAAAFCE